MNNTSTSMIVDLRKLWNELNSETMTTASQYDVWDDDYDDYVCCVGGFAH